MIAMRCAHFIFFVRDQARSSLFYQAVLEQAPRLDVPGMTEFELADGAVLGLMPEDGVARLLGDSLPHPSRAHGLIRSELYLLVADPQAYQRRALACGAREISPVQPRNWGHDAGYVLDPDEHLLAFASNVQCKDAPS
ncbi:VOC family protein [Dokdonella sp.]|uniref:VOC family protein n=1 Tax=Dokdonella sp. TaxID=2291710 RepID=UPI0025B8B5A7|nr:VOC family protein [Dokdonella sp.]MBX3688917.1 hypothetical protein [Dokdonella sp.]